MIQGQPNLVVFSEMKFALNALPETLINMLQVCSSEVILVSLLIPL